MPSRSGATNSHNLPDESASSSKKINGFATIPICSSSSSPSSPSSFFSSGVNFIEHRISRLDTLAGVAINYGVEVSDIKRVNGLVTDIQMFAHKSLQIPLPGKHPPSPVMQNGSIQNGEEPPPRRPHHDIIESLQSLKSNPPPRPISPAMRTLQGFYGLAQPKPENPNRHRRSRSLANFTSFENGDRSIRRRQKADGGIPRRSSSPETTDSAAEVLESVRKSWSATNLRESDCGSSAIRAPRKKPEAISRVFDGLPRPVVGSRNKAALD